MNSTSVNDFLDEKLRLYSAHSNVRGIPFVGDGFKQAQRKALWGMIRRGEAADKDTVERISAGIASVTDYHHGVGSLESTVVGMAQSFAGSNNIPLFEAHGQFGNRLNKKPSASRYIKSRLSTAFRQLFKKEDDLILENNISNGMQVEPRFFTPLLPLVLVNGAEGMGTGHSTYILSYNPADLKKSISSLLANKKLEPNRLVPWWTGFAGTVERDPSGQVVIRGRYEIEHRRIGAVIRVTELPVGLQSDAYEAHLQKLEDRGLITSYDNLSEQEGFEFVLAVPRHSRLLQADHEELLKQLKLVSRETENLTVWNGQGQLERFDSVEALLEHWTAWRLEQFERRRQAQIKKIGQDVAWASERVRFIQFYLSNVEFFRDTGREPLLERLRAEDFSDPERLLGMPIYNLTRDQIARLEAELDELRERAGQLEGTTARAIFKQELDQLPVK